MRKSSGFTYSELSAVILILVIVIMVTLPNIVNRRRGEQWRAFKTRLHTVASMARGAAISQNTPVEVSFDGSTNLLVRAEDQNGAPSTTLMTLELVETISPKDYQASGQTVSASNWLIKFYPDGSSDEGGISFAEGQEVAALVFNKKGIGVVSDALPDPGSSQWEAGTYVQR